VWVSQASHHWSLGNGALRSPMKDYGMALIADQLLLLKLPVAFVRQQMSSKSDAGDAADLSSSIGVITGDALLLSYRRQSRLTVAEPGLGTRLMSMRSGLGLPSAGASGGHSHADVDEHVEVWAKSTLPSSCWMGNNLYITPPAIGLTSFSDTTSSSSLALTASNMTAAWSTEMISVRMDPSIGQAQLIYNDMNDARVTSTILSSCIDDHILVAAGASHHNIISLIGDYYNGPTTVIDQGRPVTLLIGERALLRCHQLASLYMRLLVEQRIEGLILRSDYRLMDTQQQQGSSGSVRVGGDVAGDAIVITPPTPTKGGGQRGRISLSEAVAMVSAPISSTSVVVTWLGSLIAVDMRQDMEPNRELRSLIVNAGFKANGIPAAAGRFYIPITPLPAGYSSSQTDGKVIKEEPSKSNSVVNTNEKKKEISGKDKEKEKSVGTAIVQRNEADGAFSIYYNGHYFPVGSSASFPGKLPLLLLSPFISSSLILDVSSSSTMSTNALPMPPTAIARGGKKGSMAALSRINIHLDDDDNKDGITENNDAHINHDDAAIGAGTIGLRTHDLHALPLSLSLNNDKMMSSPLLSNTMSSSNSIGVDGDTKTAITNHKGGSHSQSSNTGDDDVKWNYILVCQCSTCMISRSSSVQWNELLAARFDISRHEYITMTASHGPLYSS
jgi:hypothetical protein